MKEFLSVLAQCPLFAGMESDEIEKAVGCLDARKKRIGRGEIILMEGERADRLGVILKGGAQVMREDYYGRRSIIARLEASDLFAEAFACAGVAEMPVSVAATEDTEALLIDAQRIIHVCAKACAFHQQMVYNMMRILAQKNLMCSRKLEVLSGRSTREKLMNYLMMEAKKAGTSSFTIPYDRQELADYLEVDRSGLSAEIGKLRKEGILTSERSRFTLFGDAGL